MSVFSLYILTLTVYLLSYDVRYFLAKLLSFFWAALDKNRKRVVLMNLKYSGVESPDFYDIWRVFTNYILDFFYLISVSCITKSELLELFITKNIHVFQEARKRRKGVILLSPHLGGFEIGGIYFSAIGLPVVTVAEWKGVGESHYFFYKRLRNRFGMEVLPLEHRKTPLLIRDYLRKNKIIALVSERNLTGAGITISFLHGKISFPKGPIYYAIRFNSPIIVVSFIRKKYKFLCKLYKPIYTESGDERSILRKVIKLFENEIRDNPYMWYVFQSIWIEEQQE